MDLAQIIEAFNFLQSPSIKLPAAFNIASQLQVLDKGNAKHANIGGINGEPKYKKPEEGLRTSSIRHNL